MSPFDSEFGPHWRDYLFQSLIATVVIFIVLLVLHLQNAVIVASIGATTFIIFAMPKSVTAHPRRVIGGHIVGLVCGSLVSLLSPHEGIVSMALFAGAIGLSIFLMVITDTEHPPASGTALGVAISGISIRIFLAVLFSVCVLSLFHGITRSRLRDLT